MSPALAWLVGIIEGEGTIDSWRSPTTGRYAPRIRVKMVDEDIIARVAKMFGRTYRVAVKPSQNCQRQFETEIKGRDAAAFLELTRDGFGLRRRARIAEVLSEAGSRTTDKPDG